MKKEWFFVVVIVLVFGFMGKNLWAENSMVQCETKTPMTQSWSKEFNFAQIKGMPVRNEFGQQLGRVDNVVIDSHPSIPLVILSRREAGRMNKDAVAVSLNDLIMAPTGKYLILNIPEGPYDITNLTVEQFVRYFGEQPYWTEQNSSSAGSIPWWLKYGNPYEYGH